jgi:hypothetical protein
MQAIKGFKSLARQSLLKGLEGGMGLVMIILPFSSTGTVSVCCQGQRSNTNNGAIWTPCLFINRSTPYYSTLNMCIYYSTRLRREKDII